MTSSIILASLVPALLLARLAPTHAAHAAPPDDEAVRAVALQYFRGHATGSGDEMRKAFHPEARVQFVKDGKVSTWTREEFCSRFPGKPAENESQRKRRIVLVDVTGDAAVVKVELEHPDVVLTDYLSMLRVGDHWSIIEKTFTRRDR